jgi:hypothetical protein
MMSSQELQSPQPPHRSRLRDRRMDALDPRRHPDRVQVRDRDPHDKLARRDRKDRERLRRERLRRLLLRVRQDDSRDSQDRDRVRRDRVRRELRRELRELRRDPYSFLNRPLLSLDLDRAARLNFWLLRERGMDGVAW